MSILQQLGTESILNGVMAGSKLAPAILKNVYQGIVEPNGKGTTDQFTTAPDIIKNARIYVTRILPTYHDIREQGASKDGGVYSNHDPNYAESEQVYVDCLDIDDELIKIPGITQDRIPVDLLAAKTEDWLGGFNTIINGVTIAKKFAKTFIADANGEAINKTSFALATDSWLNAFQDAHTKLGYEGDLAHGIQSFPDEGLSFLVKGTYRTKLFKNGVLLAGGANYAYDIIKNGALDAQSQVDKLGSGFAGIVDGVETHLCASQPFVYADRYLGFPEGTLNALEFVGYCSSDIANSRGVGMVDNFNVVPETQGRGVIVQPFARIGCESWYAKGNSMMVGTNFSNPYTWLKATFSSVTAWTPDSMGMSKSVKARRSRLFPAGSITAIATTGFTASFTANDDHGTDHINATVAYFQADAAVTELASYISGYAAATVKGTATNGTAKTVTLTATKYLNVLAVSDDGSLTIASKVVA